MVIQFQVGMPEILYIESKINGPIYIYRYVTTIKVEEALNLSGSEKEG